ncbi:unnamed protein product [Microthlaspi erraticum]|uniref:RBR-type E3 ubiquitin transferase n=1 Tax=Microthlaspi erraticum TaxID=1685480 RepID=A0A6D2L9D3_9BRAS|nr:unnamed protein product [Microthlaspi erraticum]
MWEEMIRGSSIPYAERVYCPNENCSYVMSKTELSRSKSPRGDPSGLKRCVKCRGSFCVSCNVPWHYMRSCKDYINSCPNNDARLKSLANLCGWRQCPNCHHMVERSSGCNRITCRCGNAFCYKCGSGWNNHLLDCYARYDDVAIMGFLLLLLILVVLAPFLLAK